MVPKRKADGDGSLKAVLRTGAALRTVTRRILVGRIKEAAYNPRRDIQPGDREWGELVKSFEVFGNAGGLVWNKRTGNLVAGHQRLKVLRREFKVREVDVTSAVGSGFEIPDRLSIRS